MAFLAPTPVNKQCREAVDDLQRLKKRERQSSGYRKTSIPESLKKSPFANAVVSNSKSKPATIDKIKKAPQNQDTTQRHKRELLLDNMDRLQRTLALYRNGSLDSDSDSDSESETSEDYEDDDYPL
jgi:hypothetical protein